MNSYEAAFASRLQKKLDELTLKRMDDLGSGGAVRESIGLTGGAYMQDVGYLQALRDVSVLMHEVESDLLGRQRE